MAALHTVLLSRVHGAMVTRVDLLAVDSVSLDASISEAAGFLPHEKLELHDATNGARLATALALAPRGSGEVVVNGAAAHLVKPGDLISLCAWGQLKPKAALKHQPVLVMLGENNRLNESKPRR